jgi:hypothetical protein
VIFRSIVASLSDSKEREAAKQQAISV